MGFSTCALLVAVGAVLWLRGGMPLPDWPDSIRSLSNVGPKLGYAALAVVGSLATTRLVRGLVRVSGV